MIRMINCTICGKLFEAHSLNATMCSDKCRRVNSIEHNRKRRQMMKEQRANEPKIYDGRTNQTVKFKSTMGQLTNDAVEARRLGLTYGKYIALHKGRTQRGV